MKPHRVGIREARAAFSKLVEKAEAAPAAVKRKPGLLAGRVTIMDGFEQPVPGFEVFAKRESGV